MLTCLTPPGDHRAVPIPSPSQSSRGVPPASGAPQKRPRGEEMPEVGLGKEGQWVMAGTHSGYDVWQSAELHCFPALKSHLEWGP